MYTMSFAACSIEMNNAALFGSHALLLPRESRERANVDQKIRAKFLNRHPYNFYIYF